jgi:CRP-like cAMP-binding protein
VPWRSNAKRHSILNHFSQWWARAGVLANTTRTRSSFHRGDPADAVFYIQKGKVKVTVVSEQGKEAVVSAISLVLLTDRPVTIMATRSDHNSVFRGLLSSPLQPELRDSEIWHQIFRKSFPLLRHLVEVRWQKGCRCLRHRGQKADSGRYGTDTVHRLAFIRHARDRVSASWHITSGGFSPLWLSSHLM